jgi:hypothetical protein
MSHTFLSTFCGAPVVPKILPITEQDVIDHFTSCIENSCTGQDTVVKYSMPTEFYGLICSINFWSIITSFLRNHMKFSIIKADYYSTGMLFDSDYNSMPFKSYYCVTQKQASQHGEYFTQDYNCTDDNKINFVVFRIYKS